MTSDRDHILRIEEYIQKLSKFSLRVKDRDGKEWKGITRLAFSPQETEAIKWAQKELESLGYICREDAFLNLHAYDPRECDRRILVGTHVDTVKNGGKYDGAVGLVSFLETLHLRNENKQRFFLPVDFVIFRAEESTMFKEALLGSKVATGCYGLDQIDSIRLYPDEELVNAMIHFGYLEKGKIPTPNGKSEVELPTLSLSDILLKISTSFISELRENCWFFDHARDDYLAYFEVHIEQGKILQTYGKDLGIVTSFRAPLRKVFTLRGVTDHSGATPMNTERGRYRRDALVAASACVLAIERICEEEAGRGEDIVGTVGVISVPFSGINKVPGFCEFSLDLRSNNSGKRGEVYEKIYAEIERICSVRGIAIEKVESREIYEPVSLERVLNEDNTESRKLRETIMESMRIRAEMERTIRGLGYTFLHIPSGAGHDAMQMFKSGIPVCMLFIPCKDGISHSPDEEAKSEDILKASRALLSILASQSLVSDKWPKQASSSALGEELQNEKQGY